MGKNKFYILFLYGDLGSTNDFLEYISPVLEPICRGNFKYIQDRYSSICYFSSPESIHELNDYLNWVFQEKVHTFIVMEEPKAYGLKMKEGMTDHLFSLNTDTGYGITLNEMVNDPDFISFHEKEIKKLMDEFSDEMLDFLPYDEEEEPDEIQRIRRNYKPKLRMDNILDKIGVEGIESLNEEEKKYLRKLSKSD